VEKWNLLQIQLFFQAMINTLGYQTQARLVFEMGVYFVGGSQAVQQLPLRCLYCEQHFSDRRGLNEHYLSVHTEAFSKEELDSARQHVQAQKYSV
jgi:hypothetical protein